MSPRGCDQAVHVVFSPILIQSSSPVLFRSHPTPPPPYPNPHYISGEIAVPVAGIPHPSVPPCFSSQPPLPYKSRQLPIPIATKGRRHYLQTVATAPPPQPEPANGLSFFPLLFLESTASGLPIDGCASGGTLSLPLANPSIFSASGDLASYRLSVSPIFASSSAGTTAVAPLIFSSFHLLCLLCLAFGSIPYSLHCSKYLTSSFTVLPIQDAGDKFNFYVFQGC